VCCSVLQCVAVLCACVWDPATDWLESRHYKVRDTRLKSVAGSHTHAHRTATHCNTLQHTATHCNTLQHTATHCNTLQHTTRDTWLQSVGWPSLISWYQRYHDIRDILVSAISLNQRYPYISNILLKSEISLYSRYPYIRYVIISEISLYQRYHYTRDMMILEI